MSSYVFIWSFLFIEIYGDHICYKAQISNVDVACHGNVHHHQHFKSVLAAHQHFQVENCSPVHHASLPECKLKFGPRKISLNGLTDITKERLQNVVILLTGEFEMIKDVFGNRPNFLRVFGTLFETSSYYKSVANLCIAIKEENKEVQCSFLNVIKNPTVFSQASFPVPWIEIKTRQMNSSVILTDKFPNLQKYHEKIGLHAKKSPNFHHQSSATFPKCYASNSMLSLITEPLLHTTKYWIDAMQSTKPLQARYLATTGIIEAPEAIMNVLNTSTPILEYGMVYIVFTLLKDCGSCDNALPHLQRLRDIMREHRSRFYYIDCAASNADLCSQQKVTGFPTLLAYKTIFPAMKETCPQVSKSATVVSYHGAFLSNAIIEWYKDVDDFGVHYGDPHVFHEGCNIHLVIKTSEVTVDSLSVECFHAMCKELAYAECFFDRLEADNFVSSIELQRRDGVSGFIYIDGTPLRESFAKRKDFHAHESTHHRYTAIPSCSDDPTTCISEIKSFVKDHSRMPVTELTPLLFHSPTSYYPLFGDLPVLVAILTHQSIQLGKFSPLLERMSGKFYFSLAVGFVDADRYPSWVSGMKPKSLVDVEPDSWLYQYPRFVIIDLHNHGHAAFLDRSGGEVKMDIVEKFVEDYLKNRKMVPCNGI